MIDLNSMLQFALQHKETVIALGILWVLSNIVTALPSPDQASGKGYKFFFSFMHGTIGALPRILPTLRMPGDPSRGNTTFFGKPPEGINLERLQQIPVPKDDSVPKV